MTTPDSYKFHSTGQFRQVVKNIQTQTKFKGFDTEGNAIIDELAISPKIDYIGTVKLHGTNGSIVLEEDDVISFHSKNNLLGYLDNGSFTLLSDNAEFAQTMLRRYDSVLEVVENAKRLVKEVTGVDLRPIKISGEWCGSGIQKGVGISYLPKKSFFIFGIKAGATDQTIKQGWLPVEYTSNLTSVETELDSIYAIADFPVKEITIDFQNAVYSQNTLIEHTMAAESECPVSKDLGLVDSEGNPQRLGEGYVWTPKDINYCWDSGNWFKTKGEKHSVSKVKTLASVCPEKLNSIKEFVDYAATINRFEQGLSEVGKDSSLIGKFIGWVSSDINKEEADTLEASNLTMKDVGKVLTTKAREWYISKLNEM